MVEPRPEDFRLPAPAPRVLRAIAARLVYWSPVALALTAFAQASLLGLRPALSEARRLAAADELLTERQAQDLALYHALDLQLRARQDPVFRERQRRLARTAPTPAPAPAGEPDGEAPADLVVRGG